MSDHCQAHTLNQNDIPRAQANMLSAQHIMPRYLKDMRNPTVSINFWVTYEKVLELAFDVLYASQCS